jgi:hypothetical protein
VNNHVHPIFADILKTFAPIPVGKVAPAPTRIPAPFPQHLDDARASVCEAGMDDMAAYAQTLPRHAVPADPDDVFSQDEDYDDAIAVRELLAHRPKPTVNGKLMGIAMDACAALREIVQSCRATENYDQFSEVDVDKWAAICERMGYRA